MAAPVSLTPANGTADCRRARTTTADGRTTIQRESYVTGDRAVPPKPTGPPSSSLRADLNLRMHGATNALSVGGAIAGAAARGALHAAGRLLAGVPLPFVEKAEAAPVSLSLAQIKSLPEYQWLVPTRAEQLAHLQDPDEEFDVLIVGGGATGAMAALEAAQRGLKVAMIDAGDFASGTSSRCTKLVHGGVRYLEDAVLKLSGDDLKVVKEGLAERKHFMAMAPHLTHEVRLVTPSYTWSDLAFGYVGLTLYDWIAGRESLHATRLLSARAAELKTPGLKSDGLKGAIEYSDGAFDDSRMNVGLATTAAAHGAAVANYVEMKDFIKKDGHIVGAQLQDRQSGHTWSVRAKVVINATGPFIDSIRKMDDPEAAKMVLPSAGTHIVVNNLNLSNGVLVPKAPNGSVAFFNPIEGGTVIGTTEEKTDLTFEPKTQEKQVEYLREVANSVLDAEHQIQPANITSAWTGIRPLVRTPSEDGSVEDESTVHLFRSHLIDVSKSGLVTIGGGKWTSASLMAQDVIDKAIDEGHLPNQPTQRWTTKLMGAHGYSPELAPQLASRYGLAADVAQHLAHSYGDRAIQVADLAAQGLSHRLDPQHPCLEAEVVYAVRHEYAVHPVDVLSRRLGLSFIDEAATQKALPRVVELMAQTLGWDTQTAAQELEQASAYYHRTGMAALLQPGEKVS